MNSRHPIAVGFALMTYLTGCHTSFDRAAQERGKKYEEVRALAASIIIDPSDGISEVEAFRIGLDRFAVLGSACGMPSFPEDVGDAWHITVYIGDVPTPTEHIEIRKKDGEVIITEPRGKKEPNQSPEPTRVDARPADEALGPRGSA